MSRPHAIFLVSIVICGVVAEAARADGGERWLFVPALAGSDVASPPRSLVEPLERALARERSVHSNPAAALEFEANHSSEPVRLDDERLAHLVRMVGKGKRSLSFGKRAQAENELQEVEKLSAPELADLQRSPKRAQDLFDTCALTAGLLSLEKQLEQAQRHMEGCVRALPGYSPGRQARNKATLQLFEEAVQRVDHEPHGTLTVRGGKPDCVVRMNGIALGKSPATLRIPWVARVQLECDYDVAGRFHYVKLSTGKSELVIDPVFEAAVHTHDALWLAYADEETRTRRMDADAEAVARSTGSAHVALVVVDGAASRVTVRAQGRDIATLPFTAAQGYGQARLEDVARRLAGLVPRPAVPAAASLSPASSGGAHRSLPMVRAQLRESPDPFLARRQRETSETVRIAAGISSAALGAVAFGLSWVMYIERHSLRSRQYFGDVPFTDLEDYEVAATWGLLGAGLGATASISASALLLPDSKRVPTAAWVVGGAGAALAVTALGFSVLGDHCRPRAGGACQSVTTDAMFGPLLALHAAPMMAVPVIYAIRGWVRPERVQLSLGASGVSLRATF